MTSTMIYAVAIASNLDRVLYYNGVDLPHGHEPICVGALVKVPLGKRLTTGLVLKISSEKPASLKDISLKSIQVILTSDFWLTTELTHLLTWATTYYHQSIGKVLNTALPGAILKASLSRLKPILGWQATESELPEKLKRAPRQSELYRWILDQPLKTVSEIRYAGFDAGLVKQLEKKGLIQAHPIRETHTDGLLLNQAALELNEEQSQTLKAIESSEKEQKAYLLDGVTGSGKTEVYLQASKTALEQDKQVLVLVPEMGLIHQTEQAFRKRFNIPVFIYTSECSDTEKLAAWRAARKGKTALFIGTRSAIFLPTTRLGLIVVDEEHDLSYKQQEGFRYHARDLATLRSRNLGTPLIMGTATPSVESLKNAQSGAYTHLKMQHRVSKRPLPKIMTTPPTRPGAQILSDLSINRIKEELEQDAQVMVFINRRGYAPRLNCLNCGWLARCPNCDTAMCKHAQPALLICHHCDYRTKDPISCPSCQSSKLSTQGIGTEQLEKSLNALFPNTECIRIDRDSTSKKGSFKARIEPAIQGKCCILVGTQMLAKGHHFPKLSLAIITDADQALFSHDYRAAEQLGQLVTQVAGRTGRGDRTGELIIETAHPDHPLLMSLTKDQYCDYAANILASRAERNLPPYAFSAILRADSVKLPTLIQFMDIAKREVNDGMDPSVEIIGPMPAVMERRRGRFRYQLNLVSPNRKALHQTLAKLSYALNNLSGISGIRWNIDVDPLTND